MSLLSVACPAQLTQQKGAQGVSLCALLQRALHQVPVLREVIGYTAGIRLAT